MGTASRLAVILDQHMLRENGESIEPDSTSDQHLKSADHKKLGGRYLLKYLLASQLSEFTREGVSSEFLQGTHYLTPTPLAPEETIGWLALPAPGRLREYVLLLDPSRLTNLKGPRWVRMGGGIEYIVNRISDDAVVDVGQSATYNSKWPLKVT